MIMTFTALFFEGSSRYNVLMLFKAKTIVDDRILIPIPAGIVEEATFVQRW